MPLSLAAGTVLGAGIAAGAGLLDTGVNWYLTEKTNKKNEALMRESWSREDNAVQRRVADLKAAGLSPTLAAGQAAASSGPVSMSSPKLNTSTAVQNAIATASAVKKLKEMDLTNENLEKQGEILDLQKDYYGYPDWAVAGIRMFGLEGFKEIVRGLGGKLFGDLFGDVSSGQGSGSSGKASSDQPLTDKEFQKALDSNGSSLGLSQEEFNGAIKQGMETVGIDTTKPKIESNGPSYGVTNDKFEEAAKSFIETMLKDNMVSTKNLDLLAHQLSVRYGLVEIDVRKYLTDLVRELRK